ncbi:MAG: hypothetical protein AAFR21_11555 [Pseudomonadota bacterium]
MEPHFSITKDSKLGISFEGSYSWEFLTFINEQYPSEPSLTQLDDSPADTMERIARLYRLWEESQAPEQGMK